MRLVKDPSEIAAIRQAARISAGAHARAMRAARAGLHEYELEAELLYEFRRHGAQAPAYPSIVRSEEHTSELQSLMRISYAVFCLKKKKTNKLHHTQTHR